MSFEHRQFSHNWADVDYDRDVFFPVPVVFQGTKWADPAEWSFTYAADRFVKAGRELNKKVLKKEVQPFAELLMYMRKELIGKVPAVKIYMHCPDATKAPVVVGIGLWEAEASREEALQWYAYTGTETATTTPEAQWVETEALGQGVRATWSGKTTDGRPYDQVNYAFRSDEFHMDVHLWTTVEDHARFEEMVPDVDRLVHGIRCVPRKGD